MLEDPCRTDYTAIMAMKVDLRVTSTTVDAVYNAGSYSFDLYGYPHTSSV